MPRILPISKYVVQIAETLQACARGLGAHALVCPRAPNTLKRGHQTRAGKARQELLNCCITSFPLSTLEPYLILSPFFPAMEETDDENGKAIV